MSERPTHRFQHTLQALIDFTGYLTTKTYALASAMHHLPGATPSSATTGIEEEEISVEIKVLKGLVLNRSVSLSFHNRHLIDHTLTLTVVVRRTFIPAIAWPLSANSCVMPRPTVRVKTHALTPQSKLAVTDTDTDTPSKQFAPPNSRKCSPSAAWT